jgi:hypothetical protein
MVWVYKIKLSRCSRRIRQPKSNISVFCGEGHAFAMLYKLFVNFTIAFFCSFARVPLRLVNFWTVFGVASRFAAVPKFDLCPKSHLWICDPFIKDPGITLNGQEAMALNVALGRCSLFCGKSDFDES